jgi:hypothetical protein
LQDVPEEVLEHVAAWPCARRRTQGEPGLRQDTPGDEGQRRDANHERGFDQGAEQRLSPAPAAYQAHIQFREEAMISPANRGCDSTPILAQGSPLSMGLGGALNIKA